jgi:hypothetical protein
MIAAHPSVSDSVRSKKKSLDSFCQEYADLSDKNISV